MTRKWLVEIVKTQRYTVEVDALMYHVAEEAALAVPAPETVEEETNTNVLKQLGEPWVSLQEHSGGHGDYVVIFNRAYGYEFTYPDILLLTSRLESCRPDIKLSFHWNGEGSRTVSFAHWKNSTFTDEERAFLCAPRKAE